jgi:hypothetical protein
MNSVGQTPAHRRRAGSRRLRLAVNALDDRVVPNAYTVSNTNDSGDGSFRQAILDANANPGADTITFAGSGVMTIQPLSQLPTIHDTVTIDGTTESGYAGTPIIELDNTQGQPSWNGLVIQANDCTIRGLVVHSFATGIWIDGGNGNQIVGNFIGTDVTGALPLGNYGVGVDVQGSNNTIGAPGAGNLISASGNAGVYLFLPGSTGNVVQANRIGTDVTGTVALGNQTGVYVNQAAGTTVGGSAAGAGNLIAGHSGDGIVVQAGSTVIQGNLIGTDLTGANALGNQGNGIDVVQGSANTVIGGTTPAARNVVAASKFVGVRLIGGITGALIQGNFIGTDATGTAALPNQTGITLDTQCGHNTIGGTVGGAGNLISGNLGTGIQFTDHSGTQDMQFNVVEGNLIGTDSTGTQALGNQVGISFDVTTANRNTIGGTVVGAGNVVSGNRDTGIAVGGLFTAVVGNHIGTSADGTTALGNGGVGVVVSGFQVSVGGAAAGAGNTIAYNGGAGVVVSSAWNGDPIAGNSVFANGGLGIDLGGDGVTANDPGDNDSGANDLQNFPVLAKVQFGASTQFTGSLNSTANKTFTLDFYASAAPDPSGYGEGARYLGSATANTDANGNVVFDLTLAAPTSPDEWVAATATNSIGDTSEFSAAIPTAIPVQIDVAPDDPTNVVDLNSTGLLGVAVLTTPSFDAATMDTTDLSTIQFGDPNGTAFVSPVSETLGDVNWDGQLDRVLVFSIPAIAQAGALSAASTQAELMGDTFQGVSIRGIDAVTVLPLTNQPTLLIDAGLSVTRGGTGIIGPADLAAIDPNNGPDQLTFSVTAVSLHGVLRMGDRNVTSFTQSDLNAGLVSYTNDGSTNETDAFSFTITDGTYTTHAATFSIQVDAVPAVTTNTGLTVNQGGSAEITSTDLDTADADNTAAQLTYTVTSSPAHGTLLLSGTPTSTFTQADLDAGLVSFQQDGTRFLSDSFAFTVSDGSVGETTGTFEIIVNTDPLVTLQPVAVTAFAGTAVTFTATADGSPAPTVQWQASHDGGTIFDDIPGATSTSFTFQPTAADNGALYRAVFTNVAASVPSDPAALTIMPGLAITTDPTPQTAAVGSTAVFTAAASGSPKPHVQWQVSHDGGTTFAVIGGAVQPTLRVPASAKVDGNLYRAVFTSPAGSAATTAAGLTVEYQLTVGTRPETLVAPVGVVVELTGKLAGLPSATIGWEASVDGGLTYTAVPGASGPTISFAAAGSDNGRYFRAVFVQGRTVRRTAPVLLTVGFPPTVTAPPADVSVFHGANVAFAVSFMGSPAVTIQWQVSTDAGKTFTNIAGATKPTLVLKNVKGSMTGYRYRAVLTSPFGRVDSAASNLTVL